MGRKKKTEDRGHQPDARYNSITITKFICRMMWQGKKSIVTSIVYDALGQLQEKSGAPALEAFMKAMDNVKPVVEVKSRRVGGATYQVPIEIRPPAATLEKAAAANYNSEACARRRPPFFLNTRLGGYDG